MRDSSVLVVDRNFYLFSLVSESEPGLTTDALELYGEYRAD